ncbi:MAG: hypothetical protein QM791_09745 [Ferruginibacter sp.]
MKLVMQQQNFTTYSFTLGKEKKNNNSRPAAKRRKQFNYIETRYAVRNAGENPSRDISKRA